MPKILNFVKKIHYYSKLFTGVLTRYPANGNSFDIQDERIEREVKGISAEVSLSAKINLSKLGNMFLFFEFVPKFLSKKGK